MSDKKRTRDEKHTAALSWLEYLLKTTKRPLTAAELAKRQRCTRATIYNRLTELDERGFKLKWSEIREGARGPKSSAVSAA